MKYKFIPNIRKVICCANCKEILFYDIEDMIISLMKLSNEQTPYFWVYDGSGGYTAEEFDEKVKCKHNYLFNKTFGSKNEVVDRFKKCSCCGHENWYNCFHDGEDLIINQR